MRIVRCAIGLVILLMLSLMALPLFISAGHAQTAFPCAMGRKEDTFKTLEENSGIVPLFEAQIMIGENSTLPAVILGNPITGDWFFVIIRGENKVCFYGAGSGLKPAKIKSDDL